MCISVDGGHFEHIMVVAEFSSEVGLCNYVCWKFDVSDTSLEVTQAY